MSIKILLEWLSHRLADLAGLILLVMMLHVTADVAMKYLFNNPIEGTLEIVAYYYMVGAVFLPLGLVEYLRSSISVELFFERFPKAMKIGVMGFVMAACAVFYGGFAWVTWGDALKAMAKGEIVMGPIDVVIWPTRFLLPIGFFMAALMCLWHLLRLIFGGDAARAELTSHVDQIEEA